MAHRSRMIKVSDEDWARHHDEIVHLFIEEGVGLERIREHMKRTRGFDAPTWQYESYFRTRKIRKNVPREEWDRTFPIIDRLPRDTRYRVVSNGRILKDITIQRARKEYNKRKRQKTRSQTEEPRVGRVSLVEVQNPDGTWSRYTSPEQLPSSSFAHQQGFQTTLPLQSRVLNINYNDIIEGQGGELDHDFFNNAPERPGSPRLSTSLILSSHAASIDEPWISCPQSHGSPDLIPELFQYNDSIHRLPPGFFNLSPQIRGASPPPWLPYHVHLEPAFAWLKQLRFGVFDGVGHILDGVNQNGALLFPSSHIMDQGFLGCDEMMTLRSKLQVLNSMLPGKIPQMHANREWDMLSPDDILEAEVYHAIFFSMANGLAGLDGIPIESLVMVLSRSGSMTSLIDQLLQSSPGRHATKAFAESLFRAAIEAKEANIVKHVLGAGLVDVNRIVCSQNLMELTPIGRAAMLCSPSLVEVLLNAGASVHVQHDMQLRGARSDAFSCALEGMHDQESRLTLEWLSVWKLLCRVDDARIHGNMELHRLRDFVPGCQWTSEIIDAFLSACMTKNRYPPELIETGILYSIATTLEDTQATEVCRQILQGCEWRESRHGRTYIKQALVAGILQGHSQLVALLLPYRKSSWIPLIFKASVRSENLSSDLIETLLEMFLQLHPFRNKLDKPEEYILSKVSNIEVTTSLAEAISARNAPLVRKLEEQGALQFPQNEDTPFREELEAAAEVGDVDYMRKLLLHTTSFKTAGFALEYAIDNSLDDFAIELLKKGVWVDYNGEERVTQTARRRLFSSALVRKILEINDPPVDLSLSAHLLRQAIYHGHTSIVENILKTYNGDITKKIDGEQKYSEIIGATAISNFIYQTKRPSRNDVTWCLKSSIRKDDHVMVQRWLEKGADACDDTIATATPGHPKALRILIEHIRLYRHGVLANFGTAALIKAIEAGAGNTECFDILVSSGLVDIEGFVLADRAGDRMTPLQVAIDANAEDKNCSFTFTKKLIKAGCNPNALVRRNQQGTYTPLLLAIRIESLELVTFLLEEGANSNTAATFGLKRTPLQLAAEIGSLEIIRVLLQKGADINGKPAVRHGGTALQLAAING
ncbi:hypothetical protein F4775DRAFT_542294, partial [Biscogniauxia sp. FL1348]